MSELGEVKENLVDINKLLSRSSAEAAKFQAQVSGINTLVENKNYEILSRFLSGTGAWKILNKLKATAQTLGQITTMFERTAEKESAKFGMLTKALKEKKELVKLQKAIKDEDIAGISEVYEQFEAMSLLMGGDQAVLADLSKRTEQQLRLQDKILGSVFKPKRQIMSLADIERRKQHRELLTDGKTNSLLIAAGLGTNLHQLIKIAKSTTAQAYYSDAVVDYNEKVDKKFEELLAAQEKTISGTGQKKITDVYSESQLRDDAIAELEKEGIERPIATKSELGRIQKFLDRLQKASKFTEFKGFLGQTQDKVDKFTLSRVGQPEKLKEDLVNAPQYLLDIAKGEKKLTEKFRDFHKKGLKKSIEGFKKLGSFLKKAMYYFTMLTIIGFILYRAFQDLKPVLQKGFEGMMLGLTIAFEIMKAGFTVFMAGLEDIREGFISGDFFKVLGGLFQVFMGGLYIFIGLIVGVLGAIYGFLIGAMVQWIKELVSGGKRTEKAITGMLYLLGAILIGVGLFVTGTWIPAFAGVILAGIAALIGQISPFADGGVTGSGLQLVGEKGPELVKLPSGSRVHSNADSQKMLTGGTTNNITIQVSGRVGASDSEIKDIANKLSRELNNRMNRTGSAVSGF